MPSRSPTAAGPCPPSPASSSGPPAATNASSPPSWPPSPASTPTAPPRPATPTDPGRAALDERVGRRRQLTKTIAAERNRLASTTDKVAAASVKHVLGVLQRQRDKLDRQVADAVAAVADAVAAVADAVAAVADAVAADDDWRGRAELVQSVPGIGATTAAQVVVVVEPPELCALNRRQIAALAGLAPINCDSGAARGTRRIAGGRGDLRATLYMAAFNARQRCPALRALADRLTAAGKPYKVMMVAVMRKLLATLNAGVRANQPWTDKLAEPT